MEIYKVGGSLRDSLLGIESSDNDYIVFGCTGDELLKRYPAMKKVGSRKSVYILHGDEYTISPYQSVEEDLMSRDLTINAIAMDKNGKLYTHPDALHDIEEKMLKPVSLKNFFDDPLRVFRAARFAAKFSDFTVSDELKYSIKKVSSEVDLGKISAERVGQEVRKAFSTDNPSLFFCLLEEAGALDPWFMEFIPSVSIPAGPVLYHGGSSLFTHTMDVMDRVGGDDLMVWMAFCHDLGKLLTDNALLPKHHGHDRMGEKIAEDIGNRLRLPKRMVEAGKIASKLHMKAGLYDSLKPSTKVGLLMELWNKRLVDQIFFLVKADKGYNFMEMAKADLEKILNVRLPSSKKGLGAKSGDILFQMRAEAIKKPRVE